MGRLPRTTQLVSIFLFLISLLVSWISLTLAETTGQRTGESTKSNKIQAYQGDDAIFPCPQKFKLKKNNFHRSRIEWYQNGNLVDANILRRLRFSFRRNRIYIYDVHSDDKGVWAAVRPRSRNYNISIVGSSSKIKSGTWCNFTLEVLEDLEDGDLLSVGDATQMMEDSRQKEIVDVHSSSQRKPINPEFRRFQRRKKPQFIVKRNGESVTLKCPVHDSNRLYSTSVIDWRKDGEQIVRPITEKSGRSLTLETISKQDSGEYICVLSNLKGKSLNFTFQLSVLDVVPLKPKLLGMQNITVRFGETARLNCSMASQDHHLSTVEWLRQTSVNTTDDDSMPFQSSPFFEVLDVDYSGGKDRRILSIENVTHEDDGKYLCLVTNKNGKSVQSSWLIVDDARQTETLQDWLTVQVSMAGAVGGAIAITSIASLFILIRINKKRSRLERCG